MAALPVTAQRSRLTAALALACCGRLQDANPLAHVFQAIDEPLELIKYDTWNVLVPEGEFLTRVSHRRQCS